MKDNTKTQVEEKFLACLSDFFSCREINNHLIFMDRWMELLLGDKCRKKWTKPSSLYYFYEKILSLFQTCNELLNTSAALSLVKNKTKVTFNDLAIEKQTLAYYPYHFKEKELRNPVKNLKILFKHHDIDFYNHNLKEWLTEGLNEGYGEENVDFIFPLYGNSKKLIISCWIIHTRLNKMVQHLQ